MTVRAPRPGLEAAFDVEVRVGAPADHGVTRAGHRRVVPILGGRISGAVTAEILAGGADWQRIRPDGGCEIDARYSALTPEGDLLYLHAEGLRIPSTDAAEALARGEQPGPEQFYFRTTVSIETSAPRWAHLERSLFIASGLRDADAVRYTAYRVS
ncbi:hypothetical protein QFZ52_001392 [Arthrobacter woluwensis]|uniref:DUF3237 domain-containing protein n=1 Tax=Arthrobacter woluwensis TaxID=156980 RepID=UPI002781001D|nr:DUF3237 domain-containing protein [Arthrobacter woluwensis]MDQ0708740.1 hypothetical protein [Arthrobacter woluwensis]